jgi:hypothetical protein
MLMLLLLKVVAGAADIVVPVGVHAVMPPVP